MSFAKNTSKKMLSCYVRNAERVTGWSYNLGNFILLGKNFFDPLVANGTIFNLETYKEAQTYTDMANLDTVAAIFLISSGYCIAKAVQNQNLFKTAGRFNIAGSLVLAAGGWGHPGFWQHALGILPIAVSGILMQFDIKGKNKGKSKENKKTPDGLWNRLFYKTRKHNRIIIGIFQASFRPFHAWAGVLQGDIGQVIYSASWLFGDITLIASDPTIQNKSLQNPPLKKGTNP